MVIGSDYTDMGVWGALSPLSSQRGFPDTLVYCVWALTMIPPALPERCP